MDAQLEARVNEAQVAVVGSMLIDGRCIGDVLAAVGPDDFPAGPYKSTFLCIRRLFQEGRPVDPVTVLDAMQGKDNYARFLRECMAVTPTAANVLEYCKILRRLTRVSRITALATSLAMVQDMEEAEHLVGQINGLMVEQSRFQFITAQEFIADFWLRMKSDEKPTYITSGIEGIDEKTYIEPGDIVSIGAEPSVGKTAFALQWATHLASKYRVGFFSLETPWKKLTDRLVSHQAPVELSGIKKRLFPGDIWKRLDKACCETAALQIEFVPASGMTAADIVSASLARRYQVIVVDYLQLVANNEKFFKDPYVAVSRVSGLLHQAAQKHEILMILLSQLSRPEKMNGKQLPPSMHSFRDSGAIEQDADLVFMPYQADPNDYTSNRFLKIAKNKEGQKGRIELAFDGKYQTFSEVVPSPYAQLAAVGRQAKRMGRRGEADDTGLEVPSDQLAMQELDAEAEDLPF